MISVTIPTRNRSHLLARALESLTRQTLEDNAYEVFVVDNGSRDHTAEVCQTYASRLPNLRYFLASDPGLHVGRHRGLQEARGDFLVFADDDIVASPTWLDGIAEAFADPKVALVGGPNLPDFEGPPPAWVQRLWRKTPWGPALYQYSVLDFGDSIQMISPFYVWGCNFSIRKTVLEEAGGFHPDAMPKEHIFYRGDGETAVTAYVATQGYKTCYHPKASVRHWVSTKRMTPEYLAWRSFIQGISDSYTIIRRSGRVIGKDYWLSRMRQSVRLLRNLPAGALRLKMHQAYWQGFFQHREAVINDPDLLAWVLRPDYID